MAFYALAMAAIASILNRSGQRPAADLVLKFLEHFAAIREAMDDPGRVGRGRRPLLRQARHARTGPRCRSRSARWSGIIPLLAAVVVDEEAIGRAETLGKRFARLLDRLGSATASSLAERGLLRGEPGDRRLLLGVVGVDRLRGCSTKLFDEREFLSPYGLRALSAYHREHPYELDVEGVRATHRLRAGRVDHGDVRRQLQLARAGLVPAQLPASISALERYHRFFGDDLTVEYPTGAARRLTLDEVADDLRQRLIDLFLVGPDGRRPCFGGVERLQRDPAWKDNIVFNEYFHGDNGAGLGASHQTGWTGARRRPHPRPAAATASTPSATSPGSLDGRARP